VSVNNDGCNPIPQPLPLGIQGWGDIERKDQPVIPALSIVSGNALPTQPHLLHALHSLLTLLLLFILIMMNIQIHLSSCWLPLENPGSDFDGYQQNSQTPALSEMTCKQVVVSPEVANRGLQS